MAILIALFLTFSMTASTMLIPNANAHTPRWNIPTEAFVNVAPNPAGVGQEVTIGFWLNEPPPTSSTKYGDKYTNMTVLVTKPDGTTQTLGPFTSDDTGGSFTTYTPAQTGNYTFQMVFGGQTLAGNNPPPGGFGVAAAFVGDYFEPSLSDKATLAVQTTAASTIPFNPLPTNYWTRPINAENNNWYSIGGNWLDLAGTGAYNTTSNYNAWSTAPLTAHIMWTKPIGFGGTVGGEFGGTETSNFYTNREYERSFDPIILGGVLYYTEYPVGGIRSLPSSGTSTPSGFTAVDLQTGQTLWTDNAANYGGGDEQHPAMTARGSTNLYCGQLLDFVTPNQYGVSAYLWSGGTPVGVTSTGTTWNMFDAFDGTYILSIVNGTSMTLTEDAGGDLIGYYVNSSSANAYHAPTLNEWNSTLAIMTYDLKNGGSIYSDYTNPWEWRPIMYSQVPFSLGIEWSVPLPTTYKGNPMPQPQGVLSIAAVNSGVILMQCTSGSTAGSSANAPGGFFQLGWEIEAGFDSNTGAQLWITNRTETPFTELTDESAGTGISSYLDGYGVYVEYCEDTFTMTGYSDNTGAQLWTKVLPDPNAYDSLSTYGLIANGTLYMFGIGDVWGVNLQTGAILWHYESEAAGSNTPYGVWPIWANAFVGGSFADGVLFFSEGHEYTPPLFRGAQEVALNLTDGQPIWSILGFDVQAIPAISDGVLITLNDYDNQVYATGMGPSETSVTAPDIGVTTATPITITGTVMDTSAGSQQQAVAANFPHGLPCVSDASMTQWMEAVYEQQPMPTNVTGVPVTLSVIDSNGNNRPIGTTTTDASGLYSYTWTPDIPGNYTLTATFAGTQSYYGSSAQTAFYASSPPATPAPTATPITGLATASEVTYGIVAAVIAIIIAIAIVGLLLLRKKP
jgi:hypothetical protein